MHKRNIIITYILHHTVNNRQIQILNLPFTDGLTLYLVLDLDRLTLGSLTCSVTPVGRLTTCTLVHCTLYWHISSASTCLNQRRGNRETILEFKGIRKALNQNCCIQITELARTWISHCFDRSCITVGPSVYTCKKKLVLLVCSSYIAYKPLQSII